MTWLQLIFRAVGGGADALGAIQARPYKPFTALMFVMMSSIYPGLSNEIKRNKSFSKTSEN